MARSEISFELPVGCERAMALSREALRDRGCQITESLSDRLTCRQPVPFGAGVPMTLSVRLTELSASTRVEVNASRFGLVMPPGTKRDLARLRATLEHAASS